MTRLRYVFIIIKMEWEIFCCFTREDRSESNSLRERVSLEHIIMCNIRSNHSHTDTVSHQRTRSKNYHWLQWAATTSLCSSYNLMHYGGRSMEVVFEINFHTLWRLGSSRHCSALVSLNTFSVNKFGFDEQQLL